MDETVEKIDLYKQVLKAKERLYSAATSKKDITGEEFKNLIEYKNYMEIKNKLNKLYVQ